MPTCQPYPYTRLGFDAPLRQLQISIPRLTDVLQICAPFLAAVRAACVAQISMLENRPVGLAEVTPATVGGGA